MRAFISTAALRIAMNVQILPDPEIIGSDDIVLNVRLASYGAKSLSHTYDVVLPRTSSIQSLFNTMMNKFPQLKEEPESYHDTVINSDEQQPTNPTESSPSQDDDHDIITPPPPESKYISIAKGFTSGPPLTLKSALKLKWNDPAVLSHGQTSIDRPPLTLRDGSLIVVRGTYTCITANQQHKSSQASTLILFEMHAASHITSIRREC
jgi:hypothetical protein